MKTVVLKWRPAVDAYTWQQFELDMRNVNEGHTMDFHWPISDEWQLQEGDRFFLVCEQGVDGLDNNATDEDMAICMAGYFCCDPYEDDGQLMIDLDPLNMSNPRVCEAFGLEALRKAVPSVNWTSIPLMLEPSAGEVRAIEAAWLNYVYSHRNEFDGLSLAKSWIYDLEHFETINPSLQQYFKRVYGNTCERCQRQEHECEEMAYHLILDDEQQNPDETLSPLRRHLHCLCNNCWFGNEE